MSTVPTTLAKPIAPPTRAVVGDVKPASLRPVSGGVAPAAVASPALNSNTQIGALGLKSVGSKQSTQIQTITAVANSASGAKRAMLGR